MMTRRLDKQQQTAVKRHVAEAMQEATWHDPKRKLWQLNPAVMSMLLPAIFCRYELL